MNTALFIDHKRPVAKVLGAANTGCRLCQAIVNKFKPLQPDLLPRASADGQLAKFRWWVQPYGNTLIDSKEDFERTFLDVSILEVNVEFRVWRVTDGAAAKVSFDYGNTGSELSFIRAAEWLRECVLEHGNCSIQTSIPRDWVPHRRLNTGSTPGMVQLEGTKGWSPVRYAALSHCWGDVQPLRLLQSNLHTLMRGIALGDLPKTFQDAVHAVRMLGIQYLWIDSLCIIQDSKEDWDIESSLMTYVYGGSMLNIAAAASNDCPGGLSRDRPSSYPGPCLFSVAGVLWQLHDQDLWSAEFESVKLNARAWVMQERMLSPRTLAFTKSQLFWECRCKRACDEFPWGYPVEYFEKPPITYELPCLDGKLKTRALIGWKDSRMGETLEVQLGLAWHNLVMLYSRQNMSFEQDQLVAIGGLAVIFAQQGAGGYLAGLWKPTLLGDLLWKASASKYPRCRSSTYRAPSWSWASMACPVEYALGKVMSSMVIIVDVSTQAMTGNSQWGRVTGGHLRLRGKLFSNFSVLFSNLHEKFFLERRGENHTDSIGRCIPDEAEYREETVTEVKPGLLCLPLVSFMDTTRAFEEYLCERGLVLSREGGRAKGHYRRWGVFEVERYSELFQDTGNQASSDYYVDGEEGTVIIV